MANANLNRLIFGCNSLTSTNDNKIAEEIIKTAIDNGIRNFDTAPSYGKGYSEVLLGNALKYNSNINITTKFGNYNSPNTILPAEIAFKLKKIKKLLTKKNENYSLKSEIKINQFTPVEFKEESELIDHIFLHLQKSKFRLRNKKIDSLMLHTLDPFQINFIAGNKIQENIITNKFPKLGYSGPINKKLIENKLPDWMQIIQTALPNKDSEEELIISELMENDTVKEIRFFNIFRTNDINQNIIRARNYLERYKNLKIVFQTTSKLKLINNIKLLVL